MALDPVIIATAIDCVLEAGEIHKAHFGRRLHIDMKGSIDLVTEVDLAVERRIRAIIGERFPSHAVLGEEFQSASGMDIPDGYCWVCDPLDGTTNFAHGLPIFSCSLGLERDGEAVLAAVLDPIRDELFTAEKGEGAFLNGQRLHVSDASTLLESMLCTGFPYDIHARIDEVVGLFGAFVAEARAVRRLGSASIDLCYVAAGRLDGFWEARLKPWDTCAGALIASEAGGRVTRWDGSPFQSRSDSVLASNGRIHDAMLEVIRGR